MMSPLESSGKRVAAFSLRSAVPMNLLFVVLVIVGVFVIRSMPVDVYPDIPLGVATIDTIWLGASADDVERQVARHLGESEARGAAGQPVDTGDGTIFGEPILTKSRLPRSIPFSVRNVSTGETLTKSF